MIHHAEAVAESACAIRAGVKAGEQKEILQFKEVGVGGDDADHVAGTSDNDSISSNASFLAHLDSGAARIFLMPTLCPKQSATVKGITINPDLI